MADMSERDRRAQILLITGFALAVIFVGLAVVLNSVIYTENLATRAEITTDDPLKHTNTMESGTEQVLQYINEHNTSQTNGYSILTAELSTAFGNLTTGIGRHELTDGQVTNDSLGTTFEGTWIKQTNASRNFTNADGTGKWTLASDLDGARTLRIFVQDQTLLSSVQPYTVVAENSSGGTWKLKITSTSVEVFKSGSWTPCGVSLSSQFWVNVSSGTVAGVECSELDFAKNIGMIDSITFNNSKQIVGTFRLMVNKSEGNILSTNYGSPPKDPFKEPALYGTNLDIEFERKNLLYRTTVKVIPGEKNGS